jgi:hypothetical protein
MGFLAKVYKLLFPILFHQKVAVATGMTGKHFHPVVLGKGMQREMVFVVRAWKGHAMGMVQALL